MLEFSKSKFFKRVNGSVPDEDGDDENDGSDGEYQWFDNVSAKMFLKSADTPGRSPKTKKRIRTTPPGLENKKREKKK